MLTPWNDELPEEGINWLYSELAGTQLNVLTFQSKNVLDELIAQGSYSAKQHLSREKRDYFEDIAQLNGKTPIWCFTPLALHNNKNFKFVADDFLDGSLFDAFRCEMSIGNRARFSNLILLELKIDAARLARGLTHNATNLASVFAEMHIEDLVAVYELEYPDDDAADWFYPQLNVREILDTNCCFKNSFKCVKQKRHISVSLYD